MGSTGSLRPEIENFRKKLEKTAENRKTYRDGSVFFGKNEGLFDRVNQHKYPKIEKFPYWSPRP